MDKRFIWIGNSTYIPFDMVLAITDYGEPQTKKLVKEAKENNLLWDISRGKAKKAVAVLKNSIVIVSGAEVLEVVQGTDSSSER